MRKLAPTLLALVLPAAALANGDSVPNVNPRDLGMAESLIAAQGDAEAAYWNPAALSRFEGLQLSLAGSMLSNKTTWHTTDGRSPSPVSTDFHPAPPPSLFASWGGKLGERGWGVGFGMNIVAGGNVFFPDSWPGRYHIIEVDRKVYGFYLGAGFEIIPQIRIGGGPVYYYTTEKLTQAATPLYPDIVADVGTAGGGFSYDVSLEIQPVLSVPFTIGIDYKHKAHQNLTGDVHFSNVPPPLATQVRLQDQGITHELVQPNRLNAGVAWRVVPELLLTLAGTFDRYVVYADDTFVGSKGASLVVPRDYGNGGTIRLGGEWDATSRLQLRAGVLRDYSGLKLNTYSPSLPDGNVWAGTLGAGYSFTKDLAVNAALFYAWFDSLTSDPSQGAFPGSYDNSAFIATVGFTWRWQPGEPVSQVSQQQAR
jgi:long-chain fatty acid transport protein